MNNLDKRLQKLEASPRPLQEMDMKQMSDGELCDIIRRNEPHYQHMADSEIIGSILQELDDLGVHPCTVTPEQWRQMKADHDELG